MICSLHDPHAAVRHAEPETHVEQDVAEHYRVAIPEISVVEPRRRKVRWVRTKRPSGPCILVDHARLWGHSPEHHVVVGNVEAHFAQAPVERRNVLAAGRTGPQSCSQAPTAILDLLTTPRRPERTTATSGLFLDHQRHARPFVATDVPGVVGKHFGQSCITDASIGGLEVGRPVGTLNHSLRHIQVTLPHNQAVRLHALPHGPGVALWSQRDLGDRSRPQRGWHPARREQLLLDRRRVAVGSIELHHTYRDAAGVGFEGDVDHLQYWRTFGCRRTARWGLLRATRWLAPHRPALPTHDYAADEDSHTSFKAVVRTEPPGLLAANLVESHGHQRVSPAGPPHRPGAAEVVAWVDVELG